MTQTKASDQTRNHLTVVLHKGLQHEIWFSKALVGLSQGWESILLLPQKRTPKVKQTTVLQGNPQKTLQRMDTLKRIYIYIYLWVKIQIYYCIPRYAKSILRY